MKIGTQILVFFFAFTGHLVLAQQTGNATFYNKKLKGHHTTDGARYQPDSMTCAHRTYPLGTLLKVRNPKNNREVFVKVTDRGPRQHRLMIDLSYRAAKELDIIRLGIAQVEVIRFDSLFKCVLMPIQKSISGIKMEEHSILNQKFSIFKSKKSD